MAVAFLNIILAMRGEARRARAASWRQSMERGRALRARCPFDMDDGRFIQSFRVTKNLARRLLEAIEPEISSNRAGSVTAKTMLFATLKVLASGGYQHDSGNHFAVGLGQAGVSRAMDTVLPLIIKHFKHEVHFPSTQAERTAVAKGFQRLGPFNKVLGAVDCTHVRIKPPTVREEAYVNHKGYHSMNCQMVCDSNLKFMDVVVNYPGRTHDSWIWKYSAVRNTMQNLIRTRTTDMYFLGDSGYGLEDHLLTPILYAVEGSPEDAYTKAHCSVRNVVERAFGVLKSRWRILHSDRKCNYQPDKVIRIILACVILHNMCINYDVPLPTEREIAEAHTIEPIATPAGDNRSDGLKRREAVIRQLFTRS